MTTQAPLITADQFLVVVERTSANKRIFMQEREGAELSVADALEAVENALFPVEAVRRVGALDATNEDITEDVASAYIKQHSADWRGPYEIPLWVMGTKAYDRWHRGEVAANRCTRRYGSPAEQDVADYRQAVL